MSGFLRDQRGNVGVGFGLMLVPMLILVGGAVDYSVATHRKAEIQAALDSATLQGASASGNRALVARAAFDAYLSQTSLAGSVSANFAMSGSDAFQGTASISIPTAFLKIARIDTITAAAVSRVSIGSSDDSCILTLGQNMNVSEDSMVFNGAPNVDLVGCTLRSNTSMTCNGNSLGAPASIAAGDATKCPNPRPHTAPLPDPYYALHTRIETSCAAQHGGYEWEAGTWPPSGNATVRQREGYKLVNICGPLQLTGSGVIESPAPNEDLVIVVENGHVQMDAKADVVLKRTTLILSGETTSGLSHDVEWPNGNGKKAKLSISSSVAPSNPFKGIAFYLDPRLTSGVDMSWKPGSDFTFDGVLYLPNSNLTVSGNMAVGASGCSKIVVDTFRLNGAVALQQNAAACASQQVSQHQAFPRLVR